MATFGLQFLVVGFCALMGSLHIAAAQFGPTCQALDGLVSNANFLLCTRTDACDAVSCTTSTTPGPFPVAIQITLILLPCENPPAVRIVLANSQGVTFFDSIIDESVSGIGIGFGALDITLDQLPMENAIGLGAIATFPTPFIDDIILIPRTVIPLDTSICNNQETTQPVVTMTPTVAVPPATVESSQLPSTQAFPTTTETPNTFEITTIQETPTPSTSPEATGEPTTQAPFEPPVVTITPSVQATSEQVVATSEPVETGVIPTVAVPTSSNQPQIVVMSSAQVTLGPEMTVIPTATVSKQQPEVTITPSITPTSPQTPDGEDGNGSEASASRALSSTTLAIFIALLLLFHFA